MSNYFYANDLVVETLPWIHIDEDLNKMYIISFTKLSDALNKALYHNYNVYKIQEFFTDYDAARFLNIDYLKENIFLHEIDTHYNEDEFKVFKGSQIGAANTSGNTLFYLNDTIVYTHNSAASLFADGSKGLQLLQVTGSDPGVLSLPAGFTLDRANSSNIKLQYGFTSSPVLHIAVGFENQNIANSLIIVHANTNIGYYCNKTLTSTNNVFNTLVNYLPTISLGVANATLTNDIKSHGNVSVSVQHGSNSAPYLNSNTKVFLTSVRGYLSETELPVANNTSNVVITAFNMPPGKILSVRAEWPNYKNISTANLTVIAIDDPPDGVFTTPGNYNFLIPKDYSHLIVRVWGGGGAGMGNNFVNGTDGTASIFNGTVIANGGFGSTGVNGLGGDATGGDKNIIGFPGVAVGVGGNAPGLGGGSGGPPGYDGSDPGGGGGVDNSEESTGGGGGGSGGYAERKYAAGALSGTVSLTVGTQGTGSSGGNDGGNGAVIITWV